MKIETVLGKIDSSKLGNVLVHEHITFADRTLRDIFKDNFFDEKLVEDLAIKMLREAKKSGIDTIVDGSAINLGRDIKMMQKISKESGVNIIASSGFYYQNEIYLELNSEDFIYSLIEKEIIDGIEGTNVRPGILKIACSPDGLNDVIIKMMRAVGRASKKYNMPIFCHHYPESKNGIEILNILESVGVDPSLVIMGHSGDTNDIPYLSKLLERKCYVGMDRFAFCNVSNSLENRVNTILKLISMGYINQILISHDLAVFFGVQEDIDSFRARASIIPEVSYNFISEKVIPLLLKNGIKMEQIDIILKQNTKRILCSKHF